MSVTLGNNVCAINLVCKRISVKLTLISTESHCSTLDGGALLILHKVNDRVWCRRIDFGRSGFLQSEDVSCELYNAHLHTEADSEERHVVFTCIFDSYNLSFEPSLSETRGNEHCVHSANLLLYIGSIHEFTLNCMDIDLALVSRTSVDE